MTNYDRIIRAMPGQLARILAENPLEQAYKEYHAQTDIELESPEKIMMWWLNQAARKE